MATVQNKIIIITAPSGAGKTSITRYLLSRHSVLAFSVSATTRAARANEQDGTDYYFISVKDFQEHINAEAFTEWEMVYEGKYYGTLKTELERIWKDGRIPVLDIDVKGAIHVQQQFLDNCLSIFIAPPSIEALRTRLEKRGTESPQSLETRLNKAAYEISFRHHFNVTIVNDDLDKACRETEAAVTAFIKQ